MTTDKYLKTSLQPNSGQHISAAKPKRPRSLFRGEQGQSALEFLLVLPVFVAAFLIVVDLGMLMYQYVSVSNAVKEGARLGSINCGDGACTGDEIKARTIARSSGILSEPEDMPNVQVDWMNNDGDTTYSGRGDSVVVRINHQYNFLFFPGSIPVVSCADMSLEQTDQTNFLPETAIGC